MSTTATTEYHTDQCSATLIDRYAKKLVMQIIKKIRYGTIYLHDGSETFIFGQDDSIKVNLKVKSPKMYRKVLFSGSIGAGETYVDGLWEVDNLTDLVRIMVLNMEQLDRMERGFAWLFHPFRLATHIFRRNTRKGAKKNIVSHYDLGNEMYTSFLDDKMMYSSAIFPEETSSLEEASAHKLEVICRKLQLSPTDKVIEIGSGWGGFAIHAAKNYGCHVTTTTISKAQYQEARKRIEQEGLTEKITLLQKDYRDLTGKFDKLVSIEMIEAVGNNYLPDFFKKCGDLLKRNGIMLLQAITITDQKFKQYAQSVDFIQRHIFPGGCLLSNRRMLELISDKTDMVVRNLEDFGADYAKTLKLWRKRFSASFSSIQQHGYDERFKRLWEFYLCYCEGGFIEKSISVVQLTSTRPNYRGTLDKLYSAQLRN